MPNVRRGESESDFVSRCIPIVMREGKTREQAAGQCHGMWRQAQRNQEFESVYDTYHVQTNDYELRQEMHEGRKHIVVPMIMMVEGVHNGSHGPLYHPADELSSFVDAWNGIPICIEHPEIDGVNVSANSPQVIDSQRVGRVYNTRFEDGKLKAEAWLDEERLQRVSEIAFDYIRQKRNLDVSVGVFTEEEGAEGAWGGEHYIAIARNHRPDHLALLPGGTGACSFADGCGIGLNKLSGERGDVMDQKTMETFKQLSVAGYGVITNDQGYRETTQAIQTRLDGMDTDLKFNFLQEVYEDWFVYEVRPGEGATFQPTLYKMDYEIKENGTVEFVGEPQTVRRKTEYIAYTENFERKINKGKEVSNMSQIDKKKVDALIQSEENPFQEDDRKWLENLEEVCFERVSDYKFTEPTIARFVPTDPEEDDEEKKKAQANANETREKLDALQENMKDIDKLLPMLPASVADQIEFGIRLHDERKEQFIKKIVESHADAYSEEELKAMSVQDLEKLAKVAKIPVDYSLKGTHKTSQTTGEQPMGRPGIEEKKKE